jgi:hypothetical protein
VLGTVSQSRAIRRLEAPSRMHVHADFSALALASKFSLTKALQPKCRHYLLLDTI